jgi:hypothetical protein
VLDESLLLTDEEFDALDPASQERYLDLLAQENEAWKLNPRQVQAEEMVLETDEFLYGGAAGGGKSIWLLWHADKLSRSVPGHVTLMLRSSFPELRRTLIRDSLHLYAYDSPECGRPRWKAADKEWHYPNGSIIEMGYCSSPSDVVQFLGGSYDLIAIDEISEFGKYEYDMLRSRLRASVAKRAKGARPHMVAASNPGGDWVKALFVTGTEYGDHISTVTIDLPTGEKAHRRIGFLPSTVMDNPQLAASGYIESLMSLPENLRRRYLEGDWDSFEGQYFPEFSKTKIIENKVVPWHVIDPFEVPHEWPRYRSVDYGYAAPFGCLWFTVDQDGYVYAYREAYETGMTPQEQAALIKKRSICSSNGMIREEKIDWSVADPAMWSNHGGGLPLAMQYAKAGVRLRKGDNDRLAGWGRLRDYLRADEHGNPGIRIFSSCENLVRTFPEMMHDKNKPEDMDTKREDHLCFVGETPVLTDDGWRKISDVVVGDLVETRSGLRPVIAARGTGVRPVVRVEVSEGPGVSCTPDHPIWVVGRGWVRADALRYGDKLYSCQSLTESSSTGSSFGDIPTGLEPPNGTTSFPTDATGSRALGAFIRRFGRTATARFRRAGTSTTGTATHSTTTSTTWKPFRARSTSPATASTEASRGSTWPTLNASAPSPPNGTAQKRAEPGMSNTEGQCSGTATSSRGSASAAERATRQTPRGSLGSAPIAASRNGDAIRASTMSLSSASAAAPTSGPTSTRRSDSAALHVVSVTPEPSPAPVFNLAIDDRHEYFTAGFLVSNCDALRYFAQARHRVFKPAVDPDVSEQGRLRQMLERMAAKKKGKFHPELGKLP